MKMDFKCLSLFLLVASFGYISCQSHDLNVGTVGVSDRLLATINHYKEAIYFTVRRSDIDYPGSGIAQPQNISAFFVKDIFTDGKGGYARVSSGGIAQRYVRFRLETQRGEAMNFTISIYGR